MSITEIEIENYTAIVNVQLAVPVRAGSREQVWDHVHAIARNMIDRAAMATHLTEDERELLHKASMTIEGVVRSE